MSYEIVEKELPEVRVASVVEHVPLAEAGSAIPAALHRLMAAVMPSGAGGGMPGVVYHEMDPQIVGDIEVFVPVTPAFEPVAGVTVKTLAPGHAISTVHRGAYERLGEAYEALTDWMGDHGVQPAGPPREQYVNDPRVVGPDETLTQIDWPVA